MRKYLPNLCTSKLVNKLLIFMIIFKSLKKLVFLIKFQVFLT